jgi:hypothetical protein
MRRRNGEDKSDAKPNGTTEPAEALRRAFVEFGVEAGEPHPGRRGAARDAALRKAFGVDLVDASAFAAPARITLS